MYKLDLLPKRIIVKEDTDTGRFYYDEIGDAYPSVTTVLGALSDRTKLDQWIERVGEQEADRKSRVARNRGTLIHKYLEDYMLGKDLPKNIMPVNLQLFKQYQKKMEEHLGTIRGIEFPLFSKELGVAGTADLIARWRGVPSIIDFKTSGSLKRSEDIEDYFLQVTLYSLMLEELYGITYKGLVVLIGSDDVVDCMEFLKNRDDYEPKARELIKQFHGG